MIGGVSGQSAFANAVTPFSPVGRQPVGNENTEARSNTFKPVEESQDSARSENRRTEDVPGNRQRSADEESGRQGERNDNPREQVQEREEQQQIRELAARDREVRAHEQAHIAVGGQYAGAVSYSYQRGPNGVNYAVGGEVAISLPSGGNPEVVLRAAEQVQRAALAPAEPSPQDRRVAAQAAQLAAQARQEMAAQERAEQRREAEQAEAERAERESESDQPAATSDRANAVEAGSGNDAEANSEREQSEDEQRRSAAERFAEINNRAQDLNRRLVQAGATEPANPLGSLFDQRV